MGITAPHPLLNTDDISTFDCGHAPLNDWLKQRAIKNEISGASRTFVVCEENAVIGYYTLAVGAVTREDAPGKVRRNMPEPIPVMILGRLAVDTSWQGKNIGVGMLKDAVLRTLSVAKQTGMRALLVHALSEDAKRFYLHSGFHESPTNDLTLMMPLEEAAKAFIESQ